MPPVTTLCMDLCMTRRTKGHQVPIAVVTAFCQRLDVMHLLRFGKSPFLKTLLTKRVCMHVPISDSFPRSSVPTLCCRVSVILLIAFGLQLLVFLAEPSVRQLRTARVGTGMLRFPWHQLTSLSVHKKSPTGFLP